MPSIAAIHRYLDQFDFTPLFLEELGWDKLSEAPLPLVVDGETYTLVAVAQKRSVRVLRCLPNAHGQIPLASTMLSISREVTKRSAEHLLVFVDAAQREQVWLWVQREAGRSRPRRFSNRSDIAQRLQTLEVSIAEEITLLQPQVAGKLKSAFDVEKVTKKFYDLFKKKHEDFVAAIAGIADDANREWYASLMLNRLMFVYFIQRKGFLAGDVNYLPNRLTQIASNYPAGTSSFLAFYREFLLRLFHEGLGQSSHSPELTKLLGVVPYLNGGLFDVHELERMYPNISIPDAAFRQMFAFFDQYQWHLDDRPTKAGNEINPDVLGYIFEKYINNKQMGAYYTKEDITEYIGKNTIIPWIFDHAASSNPAAFAATAPLWSVLRDNPDRYIYAAVQHGMEQELPASIAAGIADVAQRGGWNRPAPSEFALPTETWREHVARRQRYAAVREKLASGAVTSINDLITLNLDIRQFADDALGHCTDPATLRALFGALRQVTVLDPTCGSGAFLFAALQILEPLYAACLERMQAFVDDLQHSAALPTAALGDFRAALAEAHNTQKHPNRRYYILKSIILHNLYGVDIMDEAVEICKLRLFLKLVAQVDRDPAKHNQGLEPLPDIDFNIRAGNTLVGYATYANVEQMLDAKMDVFNAKPQIKRSAQATSAAYGAFRESQTSYNADENEAVQRKTALRTQLTDLNQQLNRYLALEYGVVVDDAAAFERWRTSHKPFHWFVEFYAIIEDRGGFDVIIGNPPYVEYRNIKPVYKLQNGTYKSEAADNLYAFCMERSTHIIHKKGRFGMIVPAGILGLDDAKSLRNHLLETFTSSFCSSYAIRPSKLFDGVDQRLCIYLADNSIPHNKILTTKYHHWNKNERGNLLQNISYHKSASYIDRIAQIGNEHAYNILYKIESYRKRVKFYYSFKKGYLLHYHRSPRYWIRAMDFEQYFKSDIRSKSIHHFRDIYITEETQGKIIGGIINSTLFFLWFVSIGNGRNITRTDIEEFPIGEVTNTQLQNMPEIFDQLMSDYQQNSFVRVREDCEFQEFRPSKSKPIIDEIDRVLAQHYGFTAEELDFIINYDIKYRMGKDTEEE